jgi:hypothetical protein
MKKTSMMIVLKTRKGSAQKARTVLFSLRRIHVLTSKGSQGIIFCERRKLETTIE